MSAKVSRVSPDREGELIEDIVCMLEVHAEQREDCISAIHRAVELARSSQKFNGTLLSAGEVKKKARALTKALKKASTLAKAIEPHLAATLDDLLLHKYRPSENRHFGDYGRRRSFLEDATISAEHLATRTLAPKGQKPRDHNKFLAKDAAQQLVNDFSPVAGARGEDTTANSVAGSIYEILTGKKDKDLPEEPWAYRPPDLRTAGAPFVRQRGKNSRR
jgi:hypothetical protein